MQAKLPGLNDGILILPSTDTTDTGCEWREQICLNRHEYVRASSVQCKMEPPPPCCGVTSKMGARMIEKSVKKRQRTKNYQRDNKIVENNSTLLALASSSECNAKCQLTRTFLKEVWREDIEEADGTLSPCTWKP